MVQLAENCEANTTQRCICVWKWVCVWADRRKQEEDAWTIPERLFSLRLMMFRHQPSLLFAFITRNIPQFYFLSNHYQSSSTYYSSGRVGGGASHHAQGQFETQRNTRSSQMKTCWAPEVLPGVRADLSTTVLPSFEPFYHQFRSEHLCHSKWAEACEDGRH